MRHSSGVNGGLGEQERWEEGERRRREKPPVAPTLDLGFFVRECGGQGSTTLWNEKHRQRDETGGVARGWGGVGLVGAGLVKGNGVDAERRT